MKNREMTLFIIPNTTKENEAIIEMLQQNGCTVMVSNQKDLGSATWQNVEGRIRYDVTRFQNEHAEGIVKTEFGTKREQAPLKVLLENGWNKDLIKTAAHIVGVNLDGDPLYQDEHYITTGEKSALEQIVSDFEIDPTFDQLLVGIYARGGIEAVIEFGKEIGMRQDELIEECLKLKGETVEKYKIRETIHAIDAMRREHNILSVRSDIIVMPDFVTAYTGCDGIVYQWGDYYNSNSGERENCYKYYGSQEFCNAIRIATTDPEFKRNCDTRIYSQDGMCYVCTNLSYYEIVQTIKDCEINGANIDDPEIDEYDEDWGDNIGDED